MRLLLVELSRFRSRRAIVLLLLAAALLTALVTVTTILDTKPVTAEDRAAAEATCPLRGGLALLQAGAGALPAEPRTLPRARRHGRGL